jgi:dsDNA-specific endonuclease/ATPase MutS2
MVKLAVFDGRSSPFARDLRALLGRVTCPVREAVDQHLRLLAQVLCTIEPELAFFLQAATLFDRLQAAGLPVCRPVVAPLSERECVLEDCYNLSLALRLLQPASGGPAVDTLVANPVDFEAAQAQVWILTGPNRGGKTVYARAVAQAQVLFQAGLFVPARAGRMSPVDAIYTHFPRHEGRQLGAGRLDDEAERLASIFAHASPHSLILINEALAGTNAIEGLALALDVVRGLRLLGARAVYVTHLLDLAALTDEINAQTPGTARVGSLVSKVEVNRTDGSERRTYRILPGAPRGTSYASTIANQRGISFAQLAALLQSRGVVAALCD